MKIIPVVGCKNCGKTTFLEKLIPELKSRGFSIAVIKHDVHSFDIDHEGKDTYRLKQAGADAVLISSPQKIAMVKDVAEELPLDKLANKFSDFDLVLTEGYKKFPIPKIEVFREAAGDEPLCKTGELLLLATDKKLDIKAEQFDIEDVKAIADFLETNHLKKPSKVIRAKLSVNGEKVPIKAFVQDFIAQGVAGMVSSLNGTEEPKKISLEIDLSEKPKK